MKKEYDKDIDNHYLSVAKEDGMSSTSTMADQKTREIETTAIIDFVSQAVNKSNEVLTIADVGCGNGYSLEVLAKQFPEQKFIGVEKNDGLRDLAVKRFEGNDQVDVIEGDIRDIGFIKEVDVLLCQRVIINLLDEKDQANALQNIVDGVKQGGELLFIECFQSSLDLLNEAREEFDLSAIPPAHHNLYLNDDFFQHSQLNALTLDKLQPNFLSTHYFVSRVLDAHYKKGKAFKRNSHLVNFMSDALNQFSGDYSPLKLHCFSKVN